MKQITLKSVGLKQSEFNLMFDLSQTLRAHFGLKRDETKIGMEFYITNDEYKAMENGMPAVDVKVVQVVSGLYLNCKIMEEIAKTYGPDELHNYKKAHVINNQSVMLMCEDIVAENAEALVKMIDQFVKNKDARIESLMEMKNLLSFLIKEGKIARAIVVTHAIFTSIQYAIMQIMKELGIEVRKIWIEEGWKQKRAPINRFLEEIKSLHPDQVRLN